MIELVKDSCGFECPHCFQKSSVLDWGTEYNKPIIGYSLVTCPYCEKWFEIDTVIETTIFRKL